jgi:hypothetical protein
MPDQMHVSVPALGTKHRPFRPTLSAKTAIERGARASGGTRAGMTAVMGIDRTNLRSPCPFRTNAFFMTLGS